MKSPTRKRWFLAAAGLAVLVAVPPAVVWWTSRDRMAADVNAIGGRYRSIVVDTRLAVFKRAMQWQPPHTMHWIDLGNSRVDDAWLQSHADDIGRQTDLTLFLRDSRVTAQGLAAVRGRQNIRTLDLTGTPLDDSAVDTLATLPRLTLLYIPHTGISDSALAGLSHSPQLTFLGIDADQATDVGFAALMTCPHLRSLWILNADNACVARVASFKRLTFLNLQGEQINADSLPALKQMQSPQALSLFDTEFSDAELTELRRAHPGCQIQQMKYSEFEARRSAAWK